MAELAGRDDEKVGEPALHYVNRLSDFLFVASRHLNLRAGGDVLWTPGKNR
jgi:cob(I)alamin adenosyltransferase